MFMVKKLSEADLDQVINDAGGQRAHKNEDQRNQKGADYILGNSLIELKFLQEEGLDKTNRQKKLASLFLNCNNSNRPVIVLDRNQLHEIDRNKYDRIMEGPIKSAISKARKQLTSSRNEIPSMSCNVLLLINDGYTALNHDTLLRMTVNRVMQDTKNIDAVVVAGSYHHGDRFDILALWPISCEQINNNAAFQEFGALKAAWQKLADRVMIESILGVPEEVDSKTVVTDLCFEVGKKRFVMPTPRLGSESEFFLKRRPRKHSTNDQQTPVGLVFPAFDDENWERVVQSLPMKDFPADAHKDWKKEQLHALETENLLCPLIPIYINFKEWKQFCEHNDQSASFEAISDFAMYKFNAEMKLLLENASEYSENQTILPAQYLLVNTEQIGQDKCNDVSDITQINYRINGTRHEKQIVLNSKMTLTKAVRLASAYAMREKISTIYWSTDDTYLWF